jgi:predicted cobalt transporter CbtA
MPEADVTLRQTWWLGTVLATALGIAACYFAYRRKQAIWVLAGIALIAAPHLIGAPRPVAGESLLPVELARTFTIAALLTAAVFWLLLGAVQGYLFSKLEQRGGAALAS